MPNHCHNRVTFYSANTEAVAKLKQIFEDESASDRSYQNLTG